MKKRFARRTAAIALGFAVAAAVGTGAVSHTTTAWDSVQHSAAGFPCPKIHTTAWGDDCGPHGHPGWHRPL